MPEQSLKLEVGISVWIAIAILGVALNGSWWSLIGGLGGFVLGMYLGNERAEEQKKM